VGSITLRIPHKPETASQSPYLLKRANNLGFMLTHLDSIGEAFIEFCRLKNPDCVVDLDASYGISTAYALQEKIKHIIATDNHPLHLQILKESIPQRYFTNLSIREGNFPEDTSFEKESIDAFHSSRMFHFYTGEKIEKILGAVFKALKPNGKFFVSTDTPYWRTWKENGFLKEFEDKKERGDPWPGFMKNVEFYAPESKQNVSPSMNFLDRDTARIHFEKAGLEIEDCFYFPRDTYPEKLKLDGREGLGIVAVKP
jgi:SAM-dependent methyltransferase